MNRKRIRLCSILIILQSSVTFILGSSTSKRNLLQSQQQRKRQRHAFRHHGRADDGTALYAPRAIYMPQTRTTTTFPPSRETVLKRVAMIAQRQKIERLKRQQAHYRARPQIRAQQQPLRRLHGRPVPHPVAYRQRVVQRAIARPAPSRRQQQHIAPPQRSTQPSWTRQQQGTRRGGYSHSY